MSRSNEDIVAEMPVEFCFNTQVSCSYLDNSIPIARLLLCDEDTRLNKYLKQIELIARNKELVLGENASSCLLIGQLAALLQKKKLRDARGVLAYMCYEESASKIWPCQTDNADACSSIDDFSNEFSTLLRVPDTVWTRDGKNYITQSTIAAIRSYYPKGCAQCIFNIAALAHKSAICRDKASIDDPHIYVEETSLVSDLMCKIMTGCAFSNHHKSFKHRIMHLLQTAMLLVPRFISFTLKAMHRIDSLVTLDIYNEERSLMDDHTNTHSCLHDAISHHTNMNPKKIVDWVIVTMYIAYKMFSVSNTDNTFYFVKKRTEHKGHCILYDAMTRRVIYFS